MILNPFARLLAFFGAFFLFLNLADGQCPTLNSNATMAPCSGAGCNVCPGQSITISGLTATNLADGTCVNWYLGTTPTFNPFSGQGTLLGCSPIAVTPPSPCVTCPTTLFIFVDDCPGGQPGGQEDNEFLTIWSGSGFNVSDMNLDFDANNNFGAGNDDVGFGACDWQVPSATVTSSLATGCPAATIVPVGPGDVVPAGVPVLVFASAGMNYSYNWGSLCPLAPTIYVMQNGCDRSIGGFSNATASGLRTTVLGLDCGCSNSTTYNTALLPGGNGAIFAPVIPPPLPQYLNLGCGFPPGIVLPPGGGGGVINVPSFTTTVDPAWCNGGPYYIVGASDTPLPPGCTGDLSNYLQFNVPCPAVSVNDATVCQSNSSFNLGPLVVGGTSGTWSGAGVSGNFFDATGQAAGTVDLTFTPTSTCSSPATATITVLESPTATISGNLPSVCAGETVPLEVFFTGGSGPWTFVHTINGVAQAPITTSANPYILNVTVNSSTAVGIQSVTEGACPGNAGGAIFIDVLAPETAELQPTNSSYCGSGSALLEVNF